MSSSNSRLVGRGSVVRGGGAVTDAATTLDRDLSLVSFESFDPGRIEAAREHGYQAGFAQGHAEGVAAGVAEGRAKAAAQLGDLRRQLGAVLVRVRDQLHVVAQQEEKLLRATELAIVDAAYALAAAVLDREVAMAEQPGRDALARALQLVPTDASTLRAHLHPDDIDSLGSIDELGLGGHLEIVADPMIEPGGCVLEAGDCSIDAQLGPALRRAAAELGAAL